MLDLAVRRNVRDASFSNDVGSDSRTGRAILAGARCRTLKNSDDFNSPHPIPTAPDTTKSQPAPQSLPPPTQGAAYTPLCRISPGKDLSTTPREHDMSYIQRQQGKIIIEAQVHQIELTLLGGGLIHIVTYDLVDHIEISRATSHIQQLSICTHKLGEFERAYLMINQATALCIPDDAQTEVANILKWISEADHYSSLIINELQHVSQSMQPNEQSIIIERICEMTPTPEGVVTIKYRTNSEENFSIIQRANTTINMKMLILHGYISPQQ